MPIKPENKSLYPKDWPHIRAKILERAQNRCEQCRKPNRTWLTVNDAGDWLDMSPVVANEDPVWRDKDGLTLDRNWIRGMTADERDIRVILTVAHLDQDPTHNDHANLKALCQRCHLAHDADDNTKKAAATRRKNREARQLTIEMETPE